MIRKYVEKVLERDAKLTPFRYIESEKQIKCLFPLTDKSNIQLKGFIDRIDEVRDTVRIIDYKSGSGTTQFTSVEALFDKEDTDLLKRLCRSLCMHGCTARFNFQLLFNRVSITCGLSFLPLSTPESTGVQTGLKQNRSWTSPIIMRILKTVCEIAWMKSSTQKPHSYKLRTASLRILPV